MSLNMYGKLKEILKTKQIEELKEFLHYQYNCHISRNDMANHLNISYDEAKNLINILLENNILEMNFKIYCNCEMDTNALTVYESIEDIPEEVCHNCDKGCPILKNVIIVYKVMGSDIYEDR